MQRSVFRKPFHSFILCIAFVLFHLIYNVRKSPCLIFRLFFFFVKSRRESKVTFKMLLVKFCDFRVTLTANRRSKKDYDNMKA